MMNNLHDLTAKQITVLAIHAVKAWKIWCRDTGDDISSGDWRKSVQIAICGVGKESLKNCKQEDYLPMLNYYKHILGEPPIAEQHADVPNERRQLMWHIERAMDQYGINWHYVHAICASKWASAWRGYTAQDCKDVCLCKLNCEELRQLLATIKQRGKSKQAKK